MCSSDLVFDQAKATNRIDIQDKDFTLAPLMNWVTKVSDTEATDGSAAKLSTDHVQWAVQIPLKEIKGMKGELFISAKVSKKAAKGKAFTIGVYDPNLRSEAVERQVKLENIPGKDYYEYSLGEMEIKPDTFIYVAPCKNPAGADGISIDRAYLVPSK